MSSCPFGIRPPDPDPVAVEQAGGFYGHPLPAGGGSDVLLNLSLQLLNLSLQNAAAAGGGKLTTLQGGVPVVIDGQVAGAVGVGGSGEQDAAVARAGIQALLEELRAKR